MSTTPLPLNPALARWPAAVLKMVAGTGLLLLALLWSYWPTLATMAARWANDPQYSHGFLVPFFAALVLWFRRDRLKQGGWDPSFWGLPLLAAGVAMRLFAVRRDIEPLDAFSLVPTLFGLVWFVGGKPALRWCWPGLAFLVFMIPLPYYLEVALAHPLRRLATSMSTYTLQTLGYPALAEGNVILIDDVRLGVAEACSGLGMLSTFIALSTAMALVVKAPVMDRIALVLSAVPIALVANVARIAGTGIAPSLHDALGWLMMPFALFLLWLELRFLSLLFTHQAATPLLAVRGVTVNTSEHAACEEKSGGGTFPTCRPRLPSAAG